MYLYYNIQNKFTSEKRKEKWIKREGVESLSEKGNCANVGQFLRSYKEVLIY